MCACIRKRVSWYWKLLSENEKLDEKEWFYFNLVQGGFKLTSLKLEVDKNQDWIQLSIAMDEREQKLLNWPNFWLNVQMLLKEKNVTYLVHEAMLRSFYLELKNGKTHYKQKVRLHSEVDQRNWKETSVSVNSERQEAYMYLGDAELLEHPEALNTILVRAENAFKKVKSRFPDVVFLKSDLRTHLQMILKGPERMGLLLPRTLLFAHALDDGVRSLGLEPDLLIANQSSGKQVKRKSQSKKLSSRLKVA